MTGTLNKKIKHWCELEQLTLINTGRSQAWILSPDLNWPTARILSHFITSFSFLAFAFHLYLGDKSFGPRNLQMDVCVCVCTTEKYTVILMY